VDAMKIYWAHICMALVLAFGQFPACAEEHEMHDADKDMDHHGYHKSFKDVEKYADKFDNENRDKWQRPQEVINALKIGAQDKIVDLGAGTGYFAFRIARAYPEATVYAADCESNMVKYLKKHAKEDNVANLLPVKTPTEKLVLPAKVNLVLVVNTYHHIDDRVCYFHDVRKLMLPGAKLVIIDFTRASAMGPPAEHRVSREKVKSELKEAGFALTDDLKLLPNQHFLIFQCKDDD
jgi:ubiquinone/menaquinone biosynthesis C-methylase UbiE